MSSLITSRRIAQIGIAGLILSIAGFALALWLTIDRAALHFKRYEASQSQISALLRARNAIAARDAATARANLDTYRLLTIEEARLGGKTDASLNAEHHHTLTLRRLDLGSGNPRVGALAEQVVAEALQDESDEACVEQLAMHDLRDRTRWLTAALMIAALASAFVGGFGLLRRNRRLERDVARRTAEIAEIEASRRLFFAKASHEMRTL